MVLFSKYHNGRFHSGQWYCGCNEQAKWHTSTKENSKGERFARCKGWGTDKDCKFFLTEADDEKARLEKSSIEVPSAPKTPVSRRTTEMMPTPNTDSRSRVNLFSGAGRAGRLSGVNDSPTAHRFVHVDSGDGDLADVVIRLLEQEGITLKSSTESLVRHAIGSRVGKNQPRRRNGKCCCRRERQLNEGKRSAGDAGGALKQRCASGNQAIKLLQSTIVKLRGIDNLPIRTLPETYAGLQELQVSTTETTEDDTERKISRDST
ncbi:hypothetical protein BBAD15_g5114 [Beauveria bassiana D1-5]|uniref:Zinc finger GRF-type domain-containing protein n=1 Tax=Beauveria bassiana D1-5 TaxID=1245745 RepID=A0A0A2VNS4_BEABA|nr:hypothetical protein BBAD15_g5114 [Beauveria bassiana D1-5]